MYETYKSPSFFVRVIDKSPLKNVQQDTKIRAENAVIIHKSRAKKCKQNRKSRAENAGQSNKSRAENVKK